MHPTIEEKGHIMLPQLTLQEITEAFDQKTPDHDQVRELTPEEVSERMELLIQLLEESK